MCNIIIVKCSWDGLLKGRNCFCVWPFWCSELCSIDQTVTVRSHHSRREGQNSPWPLCQQRCRKICGCSDVDRLIFMYLKEPQSKQARWSCADWTHVGYRLTSLNILNVKVRDSYGCCNLFLSNTLDNQVTGKAQGSCMNAYYVSVMSIMGGAFKTGFRGTSTNIF